MKTLIFLALCLYTGETRPPKKVNFHHEILIQTNAVRREHGRADLTYSEFLAKAAQAHAEDMGKQGYFSHESPEGKTFWDRIIAAGYFPKAGEENIAKVPSSSPAELVMLGWIHSPGHFANLVHLKFTELGVGRAEDGKGNAYIVQVFGRPFPSASLKPISDQQ